MGRKLIVKAIITFTFFYRKNSRKNLFKVFSFQHLIKGSIMMDALHIDRHWLKPSPECMNTLPKQAFLHLNLEDQIIVKQYKVPGFDAAIKSEGRNQTT